MTRAVPLVVASVLASVASACGGSADDGAPFDSSAPKAEGPVQPATPPPYRPSTAEEYPKGKRLAAVVAQRATTYDLGSTPDSVARTLGRSLSGPAQLAAAIAPLVDPAVRSQGEVIYPQLSGVTAANLGAMVVIRQSLEPEDGDSSSVVRVLDVRLALVGGRWILDEIGEVGGTEVARPDELPPAARAVLDDPGIELSDSARWDIYRGGVDEALLEALARAGRTYDFAVTVIDAGHPPNVWATDRPSAHSAGYAADLYAVEGREVVDQREAGSPAYRLASALALEATQLGSPWLFGAGSFTDAVHQDHIHFQRAPVP